jgi:hypothetical protein
MGSLGKRLDGHSGRNSTFRDSRLAGDARKRGAMLRNAVAAAVLTAAVAVGAAYAGNGAAPAGTKYVSKRYGYEIVLRGKYVTIGALAQWDGQFPFGASGQVDQIIDTVAPYNKFIIAAKPVSSGMSLSRWEAFVVRVKRQICHRLRAFRASSLGGEPAREFVDSCPEYRVITLAALHNGRGYLLEYLAPTGSSTAAPRRIYEAGRRAFHFTQK